MATKKRRTSTPQSIAREQLEDLIYHYDGLTRFTQDSPVLPDVWFEFGKNPTAKLDLLLNPHFEASSGRVAQVIEKRLKAERASKSAAKFPCDNERGPDIAYNQSTAVVRLCFHELIRVVLPFTPWWNKYVWTNDGRELQLFWSDKKTRQILVRAMDGDMSDPMLRLIDPQVIWMMRVIGTIAVAAKGKRTRTSAAIVDVCAELVKNVQAAPKKDAGIIWSVTRNRKAEAAIWRSTMAVKADAARRLFEISCKHLTWAIIDSGIDATHPAFRARNAKGEPEEDRFKTRVTATYDFTLIRYLLRSSQHTAETDAELKKRPRLAKAVKRIEKNPEEAKQLRESLQQGREIDWEMLKPLIEIPHNDDYVVPQHSHGTHVAGIMAADWRTNDAVPSGNNAISGVCPDIKLYDLRVLDEQGAGDEFSVIAAMQFVRYLNAHKELMMVHGVNLSLSIRHDVANFACGSTPVCEEANRLVGGGIVVVAAAGNNGYLQFMTTKGTQEGYHSISITDPGNTDSVITVGATHRDSAHLYGVSYFSSRGPTGDGRLKPDLVAPGEKIVSTIPAGETKRMDGTSMAAPHVSGTAALLLARYGELVGRPGRVKEILCKTATDLGRERYFQGAGMVDALRALQSV
ncbi:MAG TPA: S8 family serine peptidase [Pyrinomonadaceae bacterium]|nr:S8 family serine peptidase [Pyrinomonadaceae bacterium]